MKKMLHAYMEQLPEKFNREWIMSRDDHEALDKVRDIFKSLETRAEIHINTDDITLETDESTFGPIKQQGKYYKSVLPSRMNKIHYKVYIDGSPNSPIERDLYINKMLDNCFYINEGIRYFLVWQIVDSGSYAFEDGVALKSLVRPITMIVKNKERVDISAELNGPTFTNMPVYIASLFTIKVPPILYILNKYALDSMKKNGYEKIDDVDEFVAFKDEGIIDYLSEFYGFPLKFSDNLADLLEDGKTIFQIKNDKEFGVYFSIPTDVIETKRGKALIASLCWMKNTEKNKKKNIVFTYDDLVHPWFWIDQLAKIYAYAKTSDIFKKYEKIKSVFRFVERAIDEPSKKILPYPKEDKENTFTIMRFLMENFDELHAQDGQDLTDKRVRLYEYLLFPLRNYFENKLITIQNSPSFNIEMLEKIFTGLSPMYLIREAVQSELLRYFNSTNETNLFGALLRYSLHGPQGYSSTVSIAQRSLHPSYTYRLSLVGSNAGDPGTSGTFTPFIKLYNNYFTKHEDN